MSEEHVDPSIVVSGVAPAVYKRSGEAVSSLQRRGEASHEEASAVVLPRAHSSPSATERTGVAGVGIGSGASVWPDSICSWRRNSESPRTGLTITESRPAAIRAAALASVTT